MNRSVERAFTLELKQTTQHIHSSLDAILVDSGETIVEANQAFLDLHGYYRAADLEGKPLELVVADEDKERILSVRRRWLRGEPVPSILEFRGLRKDGMLVDVEAFVTLMHAGGQPRFVTLLRDVGLKKLTERALLDSEARLRTVVESLGEGLLITDLDDVVQIVNARMLALTGFSEEEMKGQRAYELLLPPSDWGHVLSRHERRTQGITERFETQLFRKDGSTFWAEIKASPLCDPAGIIIGTLSVTNDISARKQDEERLKFQAEVLSQVTEAIIAVDNDLAVTYWNHGAEELYGFRFYEALNRPVRELIRGDWPMANSPKETVLDSMNVWRGEAAHRRKNGDDVIVEAAVRRLNDASGQACGYLAVIRDISERRRAEATLRQKEEELRQALKMEAVGKLAGGVAHDFNNLLTAIGGYSEMMLLSLNPKDPMRSDVEEIKRASRRAADLTRQLLAFSRKQVLQPQVLDLNAVVLGMDKMLRRLIGADVELVTVLEPSLAPVRADRSQIEQVILNLAVNARDAMTRGGKLTLKTTNIEAGAPGVPAGVSRPVLLAVSDTGCGMDAETQARIFEPFFTTKQQGKGTGLGLSTVYGVIEQSGGRIVVESELLHGTTFRIYLPQAEVEHSAAAEHGQMDLPIGTETVLLVEDESIVRNLVHQVLERSGYKVLEAQHGAEALRIALQHEGPIDLLLTDLVMPLMGGKDLAKRLHGMQKAIKVLYMSGYTDDSAIHQGALEPGTDFIQKPFTPDALSRKVRSVIDS
ncbi:MAG: PAS domain S-box protein [Acidimicrobiia bacterium]|nr:PAS domain S-box protein [Acidimicrobiia bacterium]